MMSRVGRFGKASAAPPVAGDVSAALPKMVRNSRHLLGSSSDRELTLTLLIGRVVHHSKLRRRMSALPPIADILGLQKERDRHNGRSPQSPALAFGNNRRRGRSFALAVRCSVGLGMGRGANEGDRRWRQ